MNNGRLGVIDSLSAGLNLIVERLWVIAIPVLLDLWYWLGPQLSIGPLFERLKQVLVRAAADGAPQGPVSLELAQEILDLMAREFNLFSLLSVSLLGMPSLMAGGSSNNVSIVEVHSWLILAGLGALLILAGLAIACVYFTLIVRGLTTQPRNARALLRQAGVMWMRVVGLVLLLIFFAVALFVPFSFLVGVLALISGGIASFLMGLFYVSVIWIAIYLYFTVDAIILNNVGPIRALWNSANVVARNFWSALGLIILIFVLSHGLALVWQRLGEAHPVGMLVGIAGHAFIGSGLVAAGLLFYRDRYQRWQQRVEIGD